MFRQTQRQHLIFKSTTGEILADKLKKEFLLSLLNEVNQVAVKKEISFAKDPVSTTQEKLHSFPFNATSSMQRDFEKPNTQTELETITGFIVHEGDHLRIATPTFKLAYNELQLQTNNR